MECFVWVLRDCFVLGLHLLALFRCVLWVFGSVRFVICACVLTRGLT